MNFESKIKFFYNNINMFLILTLPNGLNIRILYFPILIYFFEYIIEDLYLCKNKVSDNFYTIKKSKY